MIYQLERKSLEVLTIKKRARSSHVQRYCWKRIMFFKLVLYYDYIPQRLFYFYLFIYDPTMLLRALLCGSSYSMWYQYYFELILFKDDKSTIQRLYLVSPRQLFPKQQEKNPPQPRKGKY